MGTGTQIGRVRGLGAAGAKVTHHWWQQRATAISNLALMTWFIGSLVRLPSLDYATVSAWLKQPLVAVPLLLLIASVFTHFRHGIQVMLEDYVDTEGNKVLSILLLNGYALALGLTAAFCVLKIAFGG
jgi:succinate dehydrogenase / fumarate reductase membrane anchor subunit